MSLSLRLFPKSRCQVREIKIECSVHKSYTLRASKTAHLPSLFLVMRFIDVLSWITEHLELRALIESYELKT